MLYSPTWSKAKKRLQSFTCPSLSSRVDFHVINYRRAHDQLGRAVITVDKIEKLSMCTIIAERAQYYKERAIEAQLADEDWLVIYEQAHQLLKEEAIYAQYDFFAALDVYFDASIEECLASSDILLNIFALLDRRVGKWTLVKMRETITAKHSLVQAFFQLRCEAEHIRLAS